MKLWNEYFHGQYLAVRAYLFSKVFLCMMALDTWKLMIGHAGRYGVAGFNVAHFSILDRVLPVPTPGHYVATLLATGLLALTLALLGTRTLPMAVLFVLYTYSWSMSMLDSYQHHYFVSLVLLCLVFFPRLSAPPERRALTRGFGYPLLAATITLLYTFTAIAKMDAQWCNGFTLRRISSAEQVFAPLVRLASQLGIGESTFWSYASISVIPVELLIAIGYALSARQDASDKRWLRIAVALTFPLALMLHLGAEALRLDIGWFSYYMLALACTFLLPGAAIERLALAVTLPAAYIAKFLAEPDKESAPRSLETWLTCAAVSGVLAAAAFLLDLPGAPAAALLAALGLWSYALYARKRAAQITQAALALGVAALLMWTAIAATEVRWDYYRYLGGDLQRRGESRAALSAYLKGERYAPKRASRMNRIRQLQCELGLQVSP